MVNLSPFCFKTLRCSIMAPRNMPHMLAVFIVLSGVLSPGCHAQGGLWTTNITLADNSTCIQFHDNPCSRSFYQPGGYGEYIYTEEECYESCFSLHRRFAAVQNGHCFCGDTLTTEQQSLLEGVICPAPDTPETYTWSRLCGNSDDIAQYVRIQEVALPDPNIVEWEVDRDLQIVTITLDKSENVSTFAIVFEPSNVVTTRPLVQLENGDNVLPLVSTEESELVIYSVLSPSPVPESTLYQFNGLTLDVTNHQLNLEPIYDCSRYGDCDILSAKIEKKAPAEVQHISVDCETKAPWVNEPLECDIRVYGQSLSLTVEFDATRVSSPQSFTVIDSVEAVLGYRQEPTPDTIDDLSTTDHFALASSPAEYFYFGKIVSEFGMLQAWEYTSSLNMSQLRFKIHRADCGRELSYCHKSRTCVVKSECKKQPHHALACPSGSTFSLSARACVSANGIVIPPDDWALSLNWTNVFSFDHIHQQSSGSVEPSRVYLPSFFEVEPGDVISVIDFNASLICHVTAPGLEVVSIADLGDAEFQGRSYTQSAVKPLIAAIYTTASRVKVDKIFTQSCSGTAQVDYDVIAYARSTVTGVAVSDTIIIIPEAKLSNVTLTSSTSLASTGDLVTFTIPDHPADCTSQYEIHWNDTTDFATYTGNVSFVATHAFTEPGLYCVQVQATSRNIDGVANTTVDVLDEILGLTFLDYPEVVMVGEVFNVSVNISKGSNIVVTISVPQVPDSVIIVDAVDLYTNPIDPANGLVIPYNFSEYGTYTVTIDVSNAVSDLTVTQTVNADIPITGLALQHDLYMFGEAIVVNFTMETGTRVNFTCTINDTNCYSWDISWENREGEIRLLQNNDYTRSGAYNLTLTAVNILSEEPSVISEIIYIYYGVVNPDVTINTSNIIHPEDIVEFDVYVDLTTDALSMITCSDLFTETRQRWVMEYTSLYFTHEFATDGIYTCTVTITNEHEFHTQDFVFTVQYAIEEVTFELTSVEGHTVLVPPHFNEPIFFSLYRSNTVSMPTNTTWSIDYGNGVSESSEHFIDATDADSSLNDVGQTHLITFTIDETVAGDYTVTLTLQNEISSVQLDISHRVYDQIYNVSYTVEHNTGPIAAFPSLLDIEAPGVTMNFYDHEIDILFSSSYSRASHHTLEWKLGDGNELTGNETTLLSTIHNYLEAGNNPGFFLTSLNVSNDVSFEVAYFNLTTERAISGVVLIPEVFTSPKNVSVGWTIDFGSLGSSACYMLDFIDELVEPSKTYLWGNIDLCKGEVWPEGFGPFTPLETAFTNEWLDANGSLSLKVHTLFWTLGTHDIKLTSVNHVSSMSQSVNFGVTNGPCFFPRIDLGSNGCNSDLCNNSIKQVYRSVDFTVRSAVIRDCHNKSATFVWTVQKFDDAQSEYVDITDTDPTKIVPANTELKILPRTLELGMYRFFLNVTMIAEQGIYSTNSTEIEIIATPLEVSFTAGASTAHQFQTSFELDAITYTYDPDVSSLKDAATQDKSAMTFHWFCRRECETFPTYEDDYVTVKDEGTMCDLDTYATYNGIDIGCFWFDNQNYTGIFTANTEGIQVINTNDSYQHERIVVRVVVQKDTRTQMAEINIRITEGKPPNLELACNVNCHGKTNVPEKFSVQSKIIGRNMFFDYKYNWTLVNTTALPLLQAPDIPTELWEPWTSGTGIHSAAIAFKPGAVGAKTGLKRLYLRVRCWADFSELNYGEQFFPIVLNEAPIVYGNCTVYPENGTAFDTMFNVKCDDGAFDDVDRPLSYNILKQLSPSDSPTAVSIDQNQPTAPETFQLPPGISSQDFKISIIVECVDKYKTASRFVSTVKVIPPALAADELLDQLQNLISPDAIAAQIALGGEAAVTTAASQLSNVAVMLNAAGSPSKYDEMLKAAYPDRKEETTEAPVYTAAPGQTLAPTTTESPEAIAARAEKQRLARQQLRTTLVDTVGDIPVTDTKTAKLVCGVLASATEAADEVSAGSIDKGGKVAENVLNAIENNPDISFEQKQETLALATNALGNLLDASGESLRQAQATGNSDEATALARRKRSTLSQITGLLESVDKVAQQMSQDQVDGETQADIESPKITISTRKEKRNQFEGKVGSDDGGSLQLTDTDSVLLPSNDTEDSVTTSFTMIKSAPLTGTAAAIANSTESGTARLVFRNASGAYITPASKRSNASNSLFLPVEGSQVPDPLPSVVQKGILGPNNKVILNPNTSFLMSLARYLPPSTTNVTNNTGSDDSTAAFGVNGTQVDPASGSVGYKVYMKQSSAPTASSFDWLCILPLYVSQYEMPAEYHPLSSSVFSVDPPSDDTKGTRSLPPGVEHTQLDNYTCFISDKVLNFNEETTIYYAIEIFELSDNITNDNGQSASNSTAASNSSISETASRKKRDTSNNTEVQSFYLTTRISSAQCRYWNDYIEDWVTDGCEVGPLTSSSATHCMCTVLVPEEPVEPNTIISTTLAPLAPYNPFGGINFGSAFAVPVNTFDPSNSAFNNLDENPLIFTVMVSLMCIYLCTLIWAKRWDLKDEQRAGASPLLDNDPQDSYLYEITVFTGSKRGAGTTSKVSMIFAGLEEETPPRLIYDDKRPVLCSGGVDSFLMAVPRPLGPLNHVRMWHDNSGSSPGWQLSHVVVIDVLTSDKFFFVVNNWLSLAEGDGAIDRVVPTASPEDLTDFAHVFWVKARKDLTDSHIWFSVFGRPSKSVFTRVQRVTCCLSLLFSTMVSNIFLYQGDGSADGETITFNIGPLTLTLQELIVGLYGSLIAFPINLLIVFIFRSCRHRESKTLRDAKQKLKDYETSNNSVPHLSPEAEQRKNKKKPKMECLFPWWFQIIGYFLCFCVIGASFYVCVEIGGVFGAEKSAKWMVSFATSFFESLMLSQPLKVIGFALFYALVIQEPAIDDELHNDPGLLQGQEYLHTHSTSYNAEYLSLQKRLAKYKHLPQPPRPEAISAARVKKEKERQMQGVLREIIAYVIFLYLLYVISIGNGNIQMSHLLYRHHQNALQHGNHQPYGPMSVGPNNYVFGSPLPMSKVGSMDSFWLWTRSNFIPYMYGNILYNGETAPKFTTQDGVNYLVGQVRLRQLRLQEADCEPAVYKYEQKCAKGFRKDNEVSGNYGPGWTDLAPGEAPTPGFVYNTSEELEGLNFQGEMFSLYHGGGYAYNVGRNQEQAMESIDHLVENNWIDKYTRVVFVEFTLYNDQMDLYTVSFIAFEVFPNGAFHPTFEVKLVKLDRYQGPYAIMVVACEILMMVYTIYFMVTEVKEMRKKKLSYFYEFWNKLEVTLLALLLVVIALIGYRFWLMAESSRRRRAAGRTDFVNLQYASQFEQTYQQILSFALYIGFIKLLKLFRFNKRMSMLGTTLLRIAGPFASFMFALMTVFVAFAHMSYLVYNSLLLEFNTMIYSIETLFTIMLNKFDYKRLEEANKFFTPIIFMSFTVIMGFGLVSFMLTIIIEGFTTVRAELAGQPNQYEIVDFLIGKFKGVLGMRTEPVISHRDRNNDFVEDVQTELNVKFGEFSEKVFAMFMQDPEDLKTMKMAEDLITMDKKRKKHKNIIQG